MAFLRCHPRFVSAVSALVLGAYVVACFGTLPSPRVVLGWFGHSGSERYPCEGCGCGCASALECWTHCCCHSEHERLVWAIENGVMPPPGVAFSDAQWLAAANAVRPGSATCDLCVEGIKSALRRGVATPRAATATASCWEPACRGLACGGLAESDSDERCAGGAGCGEEGARPWPGPTISALSCKGLSTLLTVSLPPALPARVVTMVLPAPVVAEPERPKNSACASRALEVPEPPPRRGPGRG